MRIVFCGTPQFAVPTLKHLLAQPEFEIAAVVTQPDRPRGRGQAGFVSSGEGSRAAAGMPVHQPEKIRSPDAQDALAAQSRRTSSSSSLTGKLFPRGCCQFRDSAGSICTLPCCPKYRGAAPINWAIVNGETRTGLTTMRIDAGMDTGEMLLQTEMEIGPRETTPELAARMSEAGAPLMVETLRGLAAGTIQARPQNHAEATYAPLLKKEDGRIDWTRSANEIYNRMRGFTPWPGAYSTFREHTCHILGEPVSNDLREAGSRSLASHKQSSPPGTIRFAGHELVVSCGRATELRVLSVKQEGGKKVGALEFASGARLTEGERFENT